MKLLDLPPEMLEIIILRALATDIDFIALSSRTLAIACWNNLSRYNNKQLARCRIESAYCSSPSRYQSFFHNSKRSWFRKGIFYSIVDANFDTFLYIITQNEFWRKEVLLPQIYKSYLYSYCNCYETDLSLHVIFSTKEQSLDIFKLFCYLGLSIKWKHLFVAAKYYNIPIFEYIASRSWPTEEWIKKRNITFSGNLTPNYSFDLLGKNSKRRMSSFHHFASSTRNFDLFRSLVKRDIFCPHRELTNYIRNDDYFFKLWFSRQYYNRNLYNLQRGLCVALRFPQTFSFVVDRYDIFSLFSNQQEIDKYIEFIFRTEETPEEEGFTSAAIENYLFLQSQLSDQSCLSAEWKRILNIKIK